MNEFTNNLLAALSTPATEKIIETIIIVIILSLLRWFSSFLIGHNCKDASRCYYLRRNTIHIYAIFLVVTIGYIWISSFGSIATFLGIAGAGNIGVAASQLPQQLLEQVA